MANKLTTIREALKRNRYPLLKCSNVIATGVGYKTTSGQKTTTLSIVCSVTEKVAASQLSSRDKVPTMLEDIPTDVVQTGPIRAQQSTTGACAGSSASPAARGNGSPGGTAPARTWTITRSSSASCRPPKR